MEFPVTIDSQAAFDDLVKDRLTRVKTQYADYDDLKAKAGQVDALTTTHQQALDAAVQRAETAEAWKAQREQTDALDKIRDDVAKTAGVPADVLAGTTKEELEAHAAKLKPLLTAGQRLVIPTQGDEPPSGTPTSEERTAVRALFGGGDPD